MARISCVGVWPFSTAVRKAWGFICRTVKLAISVICLVMGWGWVEFRRTVTRLGKRLFI